MEKEQQHKCSRCPLMSKCKGKELYEKLTPKQKKKFRKLVWKNLVAQKLMKHRKLLAYGLIPSLPIQVAYGLLLRFKLQKKMRIMTSQLEETMKRMRETLVRMKEGKSHSYISPERQTEQRKKDQKKSSTPIV